MKLENFFEKFELFADAPDAVAKMRELVLQLAVTGRLSEQRAGDAPVSELIDVLSASKARRGKTRKRGATLAVPVEAIIDRPVAIPAHWAWVPLNEIGAMSGGMTPSKDKSAFWDGDINWFSSKDIKTDELLESELKITREATEATGLQVYSPGCLVMVARSGILKRTFPVSILRVEGTVNQDLKVLSPFVPGLERYLQIMLRGMTAFILTDLVKTGMTVQSLKYEEFEAQPFPLPPLAEQKRIVAKVDELMALCDRLEAHQQERETRHAALARASLARFADAPTPANLHFLFHSSFIIHPSDLRKSILTLAVQGKLVPQDPNDEPAESLLARIRVEKKHLVAQKEIGRDKEWSLDEEVPPTFELPASWVFSTLAEIGLINPRNEAADNLDASFVPMKLISAELRKPHAHEIRKWAEVRTGFTHFAEGDVALAKITPCFENGKSAVMRNLANGIGAGTTELHVVRPIFVEADYILIFLKSWLFVEAGIPRMTGTAGQKRVPTSYFAASPFPLPPLAEQRRIVAKVDQLMALVDQLEAQLAASAATAGQLMEAVVAELTAQA